MFDARLCYADPTSNRYDMLKTQLYKSGSVKESVVNNLLMGATAGTIATTVCYPLDTVRRRQQVGVVSSHVDKFESVVPCLLLHVTLVMHDGFLEHIVTAALSPLMTTQ